MTIAMFLEKIKEIASEKPSYRLGGYGKDGTCDCIGLIIGAIRRCGGEWKGIHGSNYASRNEMEEMIPVTDASDLCLGDVVYKFRNKSDSRYNLPSRYDNDYDKNDYYHVGVVTGICPLEITHCSSSPVDGINIDTKLGKWRYRGRLKKVSDEPMAEQERVRMMVYAPQGDTVNIRDKPDKGGKIVRRVRIGETVDVFTQAGEWSRIRYGDVNGYMMSEFLHSDSVSEESQEMPDLAPFDPVSNHGGTFTLDELKDDIKALWRSYDDIVERMEDIEEKIRMMEYEQEGGGYDEV